MAVTNRTTAVGVFADRAEAQRAVAELKRGGFRDDQIGVIAQKADEHAAAVHKDTGSKAGEGAAIGAAAGAGVGAAWALGIAAGIFPPLGVVAGGTLMAVLASAGAGAVAAGIAGALIGLGIPEEEARYYEGEVKAGRTLVTVKADGRYDEAVAILRRFGSYDMASKSAAATTTATAAAAAPARTAAAGQTVQLKEERLHATKTPVQTGEVTVRKEVVTEQKHIDVPVEREEVVVERRPASGRAAAGDVKAEEIRIPVKEEKVHVEKEAVVNEEVSVSKRKVKDTEHVAGTVKKEQLKVEEHGDVDVKNKGTGGR
ncbi:MAG TPA: YsnF/AvaK domain-containing protein [Gemmataceae bacterium]|jgi:uncharacterized protein (TIGR02271 family)